LVQKWVRPIKNGVIFVLFLMVPVRLINSTSLPNPAVQGLTDNVEPQSGLLTQSADIR